MQNVDYLSSRLRTGRLPLYLNPALAKKDRRKLKECHIDYLRTFLETRMNTVFTSVEMRRHLLIRFPELAPLNISTIRTALRSRLKLRWKRVSHRPLTATTSKNQEHRQEAARILDYLLHQEKHIVFVDEYCMYQELQRPCQWVRMG